MLNGRYQVVEAMGSGGQGHTYLVEDTNVFNTRRVIKHLKPLATDNASLEVARRLFESEARVLHQLGEHNQIPQLWDRFEENGEFYLVMEFIEGIPLSRELSSGRRLSETEVGALLIGILEPLVFVHQHNVIHRDIKPPNIIRRTRDGKFVLIDFGAVKQIVTQVAAGRPGMTVAIGTAGYMPSEQQSGEPALSSDIYAVGTIGIQALTGLMPAQFTKDANREISWQQQTHVSSQFADILDRMVRYDCRQRYQSAIEALQALQQWQKGASYSTPPTTAWSPPQQPSHPQPSHSQSSHPQSSSSSPRSPASANLLLFAGIAVGLVIAVSAFSTLNRGQSDSENSQDPSPEATQADQSSPTPKPEPTPAFLNNYHQAKLKVNTPEHQVAFDELYQAAEQAIANNQAPAMLAELEKDEKSTFSRMANNHREWEVLEASLLKADPNNYELLYERALLNIQSDHHHSREWNLLYQAARNAIDHDDTDSMLHRLARDQNSPNGRFFPLTIGHGQQWSNLIKALQTKDKNLLPSAS